MQSEHAPREREPQWHAVHQTYPTKPLNRLSTLFCGQATLRLPHLHVQYTNRADIFVKPGDFYKTAGHFLDRMAIALDQIGNNYNTPVRRAILSLSPHERDILQNGGDRESYDGDPNQTIYEVTEHDQFQDLCSTIDPVTLLAGIRYNFLDSSSIYVSEGDEYHRVAKPAVLPILIKLATRLVELTQDTSLTPQQQEDILKVVGPHFDYNPPRFSWGKSSSHQRPGHYDNIP